jgi:hypothetical protein
VDVLDERLHGYGPAVRLTGGALVAREEVGVLSHEPPLGHRRDPVSAVQPSLEEPRGDGPVGGDPSDTLALAEPVEQRFGAALGEGQGGDRRGIVKIYSGEVEVRLAIHDRAQVGF